MDFGGAPINYMSAFQGQPTPTQSLMGGVQAGIGIQYAGLQQAMQQYQFQRMQQMQGMASQVAQNPTPENIAQMSIAFPEMSENFKRSYDMVQPQQQRANLQHMSEVHAAMLAGRSDIAASLLDQQVTALQNSNAPQQQIDAARTAAQWARTDPNSFTMASGLMLASVTGPEKYGETYQSQANADQTVQQTPFNVQKSAGEAGVALANGQTQLARNQAETNRINVEATTQAGRLQLDRDALMTNTQSKLYELGLQYGQPDESSRKDINDAALAGSTSELTAQRLNNVADQMDQTARAQGFAGTAAEAYKRFTGTQDGVTALKQLYANTVNPAALQSIKDSLGGRVTDMDMKVAMGNVPDENASPQVVSSYLRGQAKLQNLAAAQAEARASWLSAQGYRANLGPLKKDAQIMGTQVPAGTTFTDFMRDFTQQKANQISAQQAVVNAQGRSYMRFANPGAASSGSAFPQAAPQVAPPGLPMAQ